MLDELLKDEEFGRIFFAELLNQNGAETGVDTQDLFQKWARLHPDALIDYKKEDDTMEDIPINIKQLEEKHKNRELEEKHKNEPTERLAEPEYYAGNGLSPLEAFKKGLLSREETIGFIKGNIIKYVTRAGHKYNASEDMVKAIDYCGHLKRIYEDEMILNAHNPSQKEKEAMRICREAIEGLNKIEDVEPRI